MNLSKLCCAAVAAYAVAGYAGATWVLSAETPPEPAAVATNKGISSRSPSNSSATAGLPHHVFIIVLENESFADTFGPNAPKSCLKALSSKGELISNYYAVGHNSLDNYIAMVSGQPPNEQTEKDCPQYTNFSPSGDQTNGDGVLNGTGCVYPPRVKTIANQFEDHRPDPLTWGAYMEDMKDSCQHPEPGGPDRTRKARSVGDQYAAKHNPFVYFHALLDNQSCGQHDLPLDRLSEDLKDIKTTPNLVFISPNLCDDGHDNPCVGAAPGEKDGLAAIDRFLSRWVKTVTNSPAYQQDGILIITFDEAETAGHGTLHPDASSCRSDGTILPDESAGGGKVGAIVISPWVTPGSRNDFVCYNHYTLLKSVEDLFGLKYLGHAADKGLKTFQDGGVLNRTSPDSSPFMMPADCPAS